VKPYVNVNVKSYVPPLPYSPPSSTESPKVEAKIDLLEQKKKLIEELLAGKRIALESLGKDIKLPVLPTLSPLPELPSLAPLPDLTQLSKEILQAKVDLLNEKTKIIDDLLEKKKVTQLFIPKISAAAVKEVAYPTYYGQKEVVVPGKNSILESKINAINSLIDSKIDSKIAVPTPYGAKVPFEKEVIESKVTSFIDSSKICDGKDTIGVPPHIICADNQRSVVLSTAPFTIFVDTRGDNLSRGFHFSYTQEVC